MLAPRRREVSLQEVKARWAYSEITSERWGENYAGLVDPALYAMARARLPFEAAIHWQEPLAQIITERQAGLVGILDTSPSFVRVELTARQLHRLWAIPTMFKDRDVRRYARLFPVSPNENPVVSTEWENVCAAAERVKRPFVQEHEAIVAKASNAPMLLEGYLRSLLFHRANDPARRFKVWWPKGLFVPPDA